MSEFPDFDAYSPAQIAERVEKAGVAKARMPVMQTLMMGVMAGAFIGLGALYFTIVVSDSTLPFAVSRVLGGVAFSLGLILVVIAGAELFTGNNLMVMAWADGRISTTEVLRNWVLVYFANAVGALGLVAIVYLSHHGDLNQHGIANAYVRIAAAKTALPFAQAFYKGVLCNALVCLAVWLALAGHSVSDKIVAIVFPISAFVAGGFEHSVANMYFIPLGILFKTDGVAPLATDLTTLDWQGFAANLLPVTLGNIVGGSLMVALVYYVIYGHRDKN